jgi:hypothetical protein
MRVHTRGAEDRRHAHVLTVDGATGRRTRQCSTNIAVWNSIARAYEALIGNVQPHLFELDRAFPRATIVPAGTLSADGGP